MDTTRPADRLRSLLRAAGINARAATVREHPCSIETSLTVTVRSASVSMAAVRAAVREVEQVRRDAGGDVLGGGNTFVTVKWLDAIERPIREQLSLEAIAAHVDSDGVSTTRGYSEGGRRWSWDADEVAVMRGIARREDEIAALIRSIPSPTASAVAS